MTGTVVRGQWFENRDVYVGDMGAWGGCAGDKGLGDQLVGNGKGEGFVQGGESWWWN